MLHAVVEHLLRRDYPVSVAATFCLLGPIYIHTFRMHLIRLRLSFTLPIAMDLRCYKLPLLPPNMAIVTSFHQQALGDFQLTHPQLAVLPPRRLLQQHITLNSEHAPRSTPKPAPPRHFSRGPVGTIQLSADHTLLAFLQSLLASLHYPPH